MRRASTSAARTATPRIRTKKSSHSTLKSAAGSDSAKYPPNPSAAQRASTMLSREARVCSFVSSSSTASSEARITPAIVTTRPAATSADSASPLSTPTSTGSAAPLAEIGATMLIVPIARPL